MTISSSKIGGFTVLNAANSHGRARGHSHGFAEKEAAHLISKLIKQVRAVRRCIHVD